MLGRPGMIQMNSTSHNQNRRQMTSTTSSNMNYKKHE